MTVTIFGATGVVGKQLVTHALAKGWNVKAFGRNVGNLIDKDLNSDNFTAFKGYVFDSGDVSRALKETDAVLSALGGAADTTDKSRSLGMKNIVTQMQKAGVKRIVALGGYGVLPDADGNYLMNHDDFPPELIAVSDEHKQAYLYLLESNLDWTFVCAPAIVQKEANADFELQPVFAGYGKTVGSGNLALFMVEELEQKNFVGQRIGISDL